jgi:succinate dehydrogenase/fumarate reductase flavoprotein subunit
MDDLGKHDRDLRTAELTAREVRLLLKYGYPFPEDEEKLRASRAVGGYHRVRIGAYWIEMMIADLVRSAKEIRSSALLEELEALCSALQYALAHGA